MAFFRRHVDFLSHGQVFKVTLLSISLAFKLRTFIVAGSCSVKSHTLCVCDVLCVVPGVRMISLSYSRISLADIALKLQLDSPEDAEFIVAKVSPC